MNVELGVRILTLILKISIYMLFKFNHGKYLKMHLDIFYNVLVNVKNSI
jgi:hypothetical protein